jgi:two-component system, NarL family, response regulator NreC
VSKIRILVADDHALIRAGLRLLLSSQADMEVVAECGNHGDVLASLASVPGGVDIVTLDLGMPGGRPAATIQGILRAYPQTGIVVLTMHDDPTHSRLAFAAGARGYVVKSAADRDLLEAIRIVSRGGSYPGGIGDAGGNQPRPASKPSAAGGGPLDTLSEREREVLVLVAEGHTSQQIADRLFLSVKTIESYRARLMAKLGLKSRAELTKLAFDTGLIGHL